MDNKESRREKVSKGIMELIVGLSLMVAGIGAARQLHIVWNVWPSADGEVVGAVIEQTLQIPYGKGGTPDYRYSPRVEFRFHAGGREYTATVPSAYMADSYEKATVSLLRQYAAGFHHPIRYNPANPKEIQFGAVPFDALVYSFLMLISGCVLTAAGLGWLRMAFTERAAIANVSQISAKVVPLRAEPKRESLAGTVICPNCHRQVSVKEDSCPNCLRLLRAA